MEFRFTNYRVGEEIVPHLLLVPGEEYAGGLTVEAGKFSLVLGDLGDGATILSGARPQLLAVLKAMTEEIEETYRAEHANSLHLHLPARDCPECSPSEMACPECREADDGNGWARLDGSDIVRCGRCRHEWDPFEAARDAGVLQ